MQTVAPVPEMTVQSSLARLAHSALPDAPQVPHRQPSRVRRSARRAVVVARTRRNGGPARAQ